MDGSIENNNTCPHVPSFEAGGDEGQTIVSAPRARARYERSSTTMQPAVPPFRCLLLLIGDQDESEAVVLR